MLDLRRRAKGQATTEMVLLFPLFMFFFFGFVKIFAMLVLVQKIEIAAFYAARRWQLESHRNVSYEGWDEKSLRPDIEKNVRGYLGCDTPQIRDFLDLECGAITVKVERTQVWNVVKLTVPTRPWRIPLMHFRNQPVVATKYVPNRDRPIGFKLPGL